MKCLRHVSFGRLAILVISAAAATLGAGACSSSAHGPGVGDRDGGAATGDGAVLSDAGDAGSVGDDAGRSTLPSGDGFIRTTLVVNGTDTIAIDTGSAFAASGDIYSCGTSTMTEDHGIGLGWRREAVTEPGTYDVDVSAGHYISIVRPRPGEPGSSRYSTAGEGTITFTVVDYDRSIFEGTFADVLMARSDPEDTISITATAGEFRCIP